MDIMKNIDIDIINTKYNTLYRLIEDDHKSTIASLWRRTLHGIDLIRYESFLAETKIVTNSHDPLYASYMRKMLVVKQNYIIRWVINHEKNKRFK